MSIKQDVPPELLAKLVRVDPETGHIFWLYRPTEMFADNGRYSAARNQKIWNTRYAGRRAFCKPNGKGYVAGKLFTRDIVGHQVAWALYYGAWPKQEIDHINGVRDDNRKANLRLVSVAENRRNAARPSHNTSGHVGVGYRPKRGRIAQWRAYIKVAGKQIELGHYTTKEQAIAARKAAERKYGFHENHGRA